jgi:hypothetical protein
LRLYANQFGKIVDIACYMCIHHTCSRAAEPPVVLWTLVFTMSSAANLGSRGDVTRNVFVLRARKVPRSDITACTMCIRPAGLCSKNVQSAPCISSWDENWLLLYRLKQRREQRAVEWQPATAFSQSVCGSPSCDSCCDFARAEVSPNRSACDVPRGRSRGQR